MHRPEPLIELDGVYLSEWSFHGFNLQRTRCSLVLEHFDPSKTLVVTADASFMDIGGILLQHADNGRIYAVYHISAQSRNDTQRNYSQLEKEAFALISTVESIAFYQLHDSILQKLEFQLCQQFKTTIIDDEEIEKVIQSLRSD
uniref:Reverse transcriptase/retrotransposon-derived protein RNase H-like domain-containing protein n=1 Tax=Vespula pensylvanica TaxID=30213 RepID=A0A834PF73_VESPE|nr:hypothetical protein H0235_001028 [Vespula pensylvanica]